MMNFIKNKSVGYWIAAGLALFSLIVAIVFFATYNNPAFGDPVTNSGPMGNAAAGVAPVTIGIFLLAGFAVEVAVLAIPQYRFLHFLAVIMFSLALYKEIIIIPDFFAGMATGIFYNGGNLGLNMFYFISLILIVIISIVVAFFGFYKKEAVAQQEMKLEKNGISKFIRLGAGATIVVVAVLVATLTTSSVLKAAGAGRKGDGSSSSDVTSSEPVDPDIPVFNPITEEIAQACEDYEYDFDPMDVLIKEQEEWDYSDSELSALSKGAKTRDDHYLVYYFEGAYAEGYQGDYSETYGYLYLWDDGLFTGTVNSTSMKGFWYNSSLTEGFKQDVTVDEEGNEVMGDPYDVVDCLNMVSQESKYESIITAPSSGFYERAAYVYLGFSWGTRSMILNGYRYYPEVALAIDYTSTGLDFKVGEKFDRSGWTANRILKNQNFSPVFKASEVSWTDEAGMLQNGRFVAAGEYEVKAKWNGFEATVTVNVTDDEAEPEPQDPAPEA